MLLFFLKKSHPENRCVCKNFVRSIEQRSQHVRKRDAKRGVGETRRRGARRRLHARARCGAHRQRSANLRGVALFVVGQQACARVFVTSNAQNRLQSFIIFSHEPVCSLHNATMASTAKRNVN